jgi:hypothetical protein
MYGTKAVGKLPMPSYLLFLTRDSLTIAASFNIPPILSNHIEASIMAEVFPDPLI